jgi:Glyoxalase-like domain
VARLEKLGAELVQQAHFWQVMRDPAGLLFCVIPESPGTLDESNAQRWD